MNQFLNKIWPWLASRWRQLVRSGRTFIQRLEALPPPLIYPGGEIDGLWRRRTAAPPRQYERPPRKTPPPRTACPGESCPSPAQVIPVDKRAMVR